MWTNSRIGDKEERERYWCLVDQMKREGGKEGAVEYSRRDGCMKWQTVSCLRIWPAGTNENEFWSNEKMADEALCGALPSYFKVGLKDWREGWPDDVYGHAMLKGG